MTCILLVPFYKIKTEDIDIPFKQYGQYFSLIALNQSSDYSINASPYALFKGAVHGHIICIVW